MLSIFHVLEEVKEAFKSKESEALEEVKRSTILPVEDRQYREKVYEKEGLQVDERSVSNVCD